MQTWLAMVLMGLMFQQPDAETKIVRYLQENVKPGVPVVVSDLTNEVFTSPEEQQMLSGLFNKFFKIPLFLVQYNASTGELPTLQQISEQFSFNVDGEADVILRIMEADPRVPKFFERDARTGEITSIDVEPIRNHPQFGKAVERTIAGWEGKPVPSFSIETFAGDALTSQMVAGKPHMVYIWFTNCPPCLKTAPLLVDLHNKYAKEGFEIVAANADRMLELPYDDAMRAAYVEKLGIEFTTAHLNTAMQNAYGGVNLFPTMFFVNKEGVVVKHFVNFQEKEVLDGAINMALR
jgi:thiol-disulfide isomerase/thioredoxin